MYINDDYRLYIKIIKDNYNIKFINNTFRINLIRRTRLYSPKLSRTRLFSTIINTKHVIKI